MRDEVKGTEWKLKTGLGGWKQWHLQVWKRPTYRRGVGLALFTPGRLSIVSQEGFSM